MTAETALALPVLVVVLAACLWGVRVVAAQLRCVDAAREAARAIARGDPLPAARAAAVAAAPSGARVGVQTAPDLVVVRVSVRVAGFLPAVAGVQVAASAATRPEPGALAAAAPSGRAGP